MSPAFLPLIVVLRRCRGLPFHAATRVGQQGAMATATLASRTAFKWSALTLLVLFFWAYEGLSDTDLDGLAESSTTFWWPLP